MLNIVSSILAPQVPTPVNDYESIATTTLGSASATVTFSSIPATFTHLQLRISELASSPGDNCSIRFNSDTASNYSWHYLLGNGATASASAGATQTNGILYTSTAASTIANVGIADILDYANTNKYKTVRSLGGQDSNGSGNVALFSTNWRSTSAITSITLLRTGGNFNTNSSFALYGIKG
jgi:hypothetical protein